MVPSHLNRKKYRRAMQEMVMTIFRDEGAKVSTTVVSMILGLAPELLKRMISTEWHMALFGPVDTTPSLHTDQLVGGDNPYYCVIKLAAQIETDTWPEMNKRDLIPRPQTRPASFTYAIDPHTKKPVPVAIEHNIVTRAAATARWIVAAPPVDGRGQPKYTKVEQVLQVAERKLHPVVLQAVIADEDRYQRYLEAQSQTRDSKPDLTQYRKATEMMIAPRDQLQLLDSEENSREIVLGTGWTIKVLAFAPLEPASEGEEGEDLMPLSARYLEEGVPEIRPVAILPVPVLEASTSQTSGRVSEEQPPPVSTSKGSGKKKIVTKKGMKTVKKTDEEKKAADSERRRLKNLERRKRQREEKAQGGQQVTTGADGEGTEETVTVTELDEQGQVMTSGAEMVPEPMQHDETVVVPQQAMQALSVSAVDADEGGSMATTMEEEILIYEDEFDLVGDPARALPPLPLRPMDSGLGKVIRAAESQEVDRNPFASTPIDSSASVGRMQTPELVDITSSDAEGTSSQVRDTNLVNFMSQKGNVPQGPATKTKAPGSTSPLKRSNRETRPPARLADPAVWTPGIVRPTTAQNPVIVSSSVSTIQDRGVTSSSEESSSSSRAQKRFKSTQSSTLPVTRSSPTHPVRSLEPSGYEVAESTDEELRKTRRVFTPTRGRGQISTATAAKKPPVLVPMQPRVPFGAAVSQPLGAATAPAVQSSESVPGPSSTMTRQDTTPSTTGVPAKKERNREIPQQILQQTKGRPLPQRTLKSVQRQIRWATITAVETRKQDDRPPTPYIPPGEKGPGKRSNRYAFCTRCGSLVHEQGGNVALMGYCPMRTCTAPAAHAEGAPTVISRTGDMNDPFFLYVKRYVQDQSIAMNIHEAYKLFWAHATASVVARMCRDGNVSYFLFETWRAVVNPTHKQVLEKAKELGNEGCGGDSYHSDLVSAAGC
jgi:hypothetical protein